MIWSIHPFNIIAVWYTHKKRKERCQYVWFSAIWVCVCVCLFCITVSNTMIIIAWYSPNWTLLPILCVFSILFALKCTLRFPLLLLLLLVQLLYCTVKSITFLLAHFIRQLNIITGEYNNNKILLRRSFNRSCWN